MGGWEDELGDAYSRNMRSLNDGTSLRNAAMIMFQTFKGMDFAAVALRYSSYAVFRHRGSSIRTHLAMAPHSLKRW